MPKDYADHSYEDILADDTAKAYAEVLERTASETTAPARKAETPAEGDGEGAASREPKAEVISDTSKNPTKPEVRDDGRDERGRFAPKDGAQKPAEAPANAADKPVDKTATPAETPPAVAGGPPPSWSIKSKAAWDALPADVRADIVKREGEVAQGLSALRDYKDLKPWAEMAKQHNTTIDAALKRYTGIEQLLKRDLAAGLSQIAQNAGLSQPDAARFFAGLAARLGGTAAPQPNGAHPHTNGAMPADDPLMQALKPVLSPIMQELSQLRTQVSSRVEADRNAQSQSLAKAIEKFAADPAHRYYPELEETITRLFETGMVPPSGNPEGDIRAAYEMAVGMNPEIREALIEQRLAEAREAERQREQEAADKAKAASRSITGSRVPGTVVQDRDAPRGNYDEDLEADVRRAMRLSARA